MNGIVRTDPVRPPAANDDEAGAPEVRAAREVIDVRPDQVFQHEPQRPAPWVQRSFFAPVLLVLALSAAFLYGLIALCALLWAWLR